jgi:hypothetical protein
MNRILSAVAIFLVLSGLAFAQTAMRTTTLSLPVGVNDKSINLTSVTGVNPLSGGQVATILFVDKEVMYVQSVTGSSATVTRGQNGSDSTAHNAGATVYVGPPGAYGTRNLSGACNESSWPVTPYININNGNIYTCTSNNWVLQGTGGGGGGTLTGCGFGNVLNGTVCDVNTAVIPSQAILQSGVPIYCAGSGTAGAQTCSLSPVLTQYTNGMTISYNPGTTNTTTQTINIDSLGAKSILTASAGALSAGDLTAGRRYLLNYDGTQFRLPAAGGASATAIDAAFYPTGPMNSAGGAATIGANNRVNYFPFMVARPTIVRNYKSYTNVSVGTFGFGIMDSSCNLVSGTTATATAAANVGIRARMSASVTLDPGKYWVAYTGTLSTDGMYAAFEQFANDVRNAGETAPTFQQFYGSNASSAGVVPSSCGTRTTTTTVNGSSPVIWIDNQ